MFYLRISSNLEMWKTFLGVHTFEHSVCKILHKAFTTLFIEISRVLLP